MRTLTDHIFSGDQAVQLQITVMDEPGAGGANHAYEISWDRQASHPDGTQFFVHEHAYVRFQNGPIKENGVNGVTQEALLAIVIDRLRSFQAGPFSCGENQNALEHCKAALDMLKHRTRERIARGIEGTTQK